MYINVVFFRFPKKPSEFKEALGVTNGGITDSQMTASSEWYVNLGRHAPNLGRLHYQANGLKQGGWVAGSKNFDEWLQIDLINRNTRVRNGNYAQWVAVYKLQYSNDGTTFLYYREQGESADKVR